MLAGIEFFQKAAALQQKYSRKGLRIENTIQTNGVLIDREWAQFFAEHDFLVGISLDGPRKIHDAYRTDANGNPTFTRIMNGIALLRERGVRLNIATVVTEELAHQAAYLYKQLLLCAADPMYGKFVGNRWKDCGGRKRVFCKTGILW